jgi:DNA-binding FrmR family transcriptional regulator
VNNSNLPAGGTNEQVQRKVIARLRRLAGQAGALEASYVSGDKEKFILQLEAVTAAARACLSYVAEHELLASENPADKQLVARLIRKP